MSLVINSRIGILDDFYFFPLLLSKFSAWTLIALEIRKKKKKNGEQKGNVKTRSGA